MKLLPLLAGGIFPLMAIVRKLDSKRRAVFPDRFSPGDVFIEEVSETVVTFRLIEPNDAPKAEIEEVEGKHYVVAPVDRDSIAKAMRLERDSR